MEPTPVIIGLLGFIVLFTLMFLNMPVAYAFLLAGFLGTWYVRDWVAALGTLPTTAWGMISNYTLICLPLFQFMGNLANYSGIGPDLYQTAQKWWGKMPGGLALTTIWGNAAFGAVTGSTLSGIVAFTPIAWKPMLGLGYDRRLAAGSLICSGTLASLIPPSMNFILYSAVTGESIGRLFMSGIFPGILQAVMYAGLVLILTGLHILAGPPSSGSTWKEKFVSLKGVWGMVFVFVLVIGGIYLGIFTPTEGGAVGVAGTFIIFVFRRGLNIKMLLAGFDDSLRTSAMVFLILFCAMVFANFIALCGMSGWIVDNVVGIGINKYFVLVAALVVFFIAGCVMPATAMILLFVPLFYPIFVTQMGMDGIWYGVIVVIMAELAVVTPPIGVHLFIFQSLVGEEITTIQMWQGVVPFVLTDIARLAILVAFPIISVWLPQHMFQF